MALNSIEEIVEDLRQGKMVIIMDDEDRENEGDLLIAADKVTPEAINFMAKYGRGLICLTLTRERCQQLRLPLMVNVNDQLAATNFTISIEAAEGVTTGISAADRAKTVLAAVKPDARPEDLVQPGHIFPLMAQPGGVLVRAGHTEAGCDLARLAGFEPAAVIVEILNEDGTMARRPDLEKFAAEHGLKIGTIEDLIHYRVKNEKSVERVAQTQITTEQGEFELITYQNHVSGNIHFALVKGDVAGDEPALVRVHLQDALVDFLSITGEGFGWPLHDAMRRVNESGRGVVVILRHPESEESLIQRVRDLGTRTEAGIDKPKDAPEDVRTFGVGAQILVDLGVRKMRLLSAPKKFHALGGFDLEVVEYIWDDNF